MCGSQVGWGGPQPGTCFHWLLSSSHQGRSPHGPLARGPKHPAGAPALDLGRPNAKNTIKLAGKPKLEMVKGYVVQEARQTYGDWATLVFRHVAF